MSETLRNIIDGYHSDLLSTTNIQVIEKNYLMKQSSSRVS